MLKKILFKVHSSLFSKTIAFTLAETLIVMGIIGVVAALTLPNLNSSTGDKEKVAKVKKIASNLEDAVGRAQAVYGPISEWCKSYNDSCTKRKFDRITEFLKYSKMCTISDNCALLEYDKNGSGGAIPTCAVVLSDETMLAMESGNEDILFVFDIDGTNKGLNRSGDDVFKVFANDNGIDTSYANYANFYNKYKDCDYLERGLEGFKWIVNFGNMDYTKADKNGLCPDGKTVLNWTTNTTCK